MSQHVLSMSSCVQQKALLCWKVRCIGHSLRYLSFWPSSQHISWMNRASAHSAHGLTCLWFFCEGRSRSSCSNRQQAFSGLVCFLFDMVSFFFVDCRECPYCTTTQMGVTWDPTCKEPLKFLRAISVLQVIQHGHSGLACRETHNACPYCLNANYGSLGIWRCSRPIVPNVQVRLAETEKNPGTMMCNSGKRCEICNVIHGFHGHDEFSDGTIAFAFDRFLSETLYRLSGHYASALKTARTVRRQRRVAELTCKGVANFLRSAIAFCPRMSQAIAINNIQ